MNDFCQRKPKKNLNHRIGHAVTNKQTNQIVHNQLVADVF